MGILEGTYVAGERDEDNEADDCGAGAVTACGAGGIGAALARLIVDVDCYEGNGVPCSEGKSCETTKGTDGKDMSVVLCNVHGGLKHQDAKGDPRDPADEAYDTENREDNEDDCRGVLFFVEIVNCCANTKDDLEDACYPDKLFCESSSKCKVCP